MLNEIRFRAMGTDIGVWLWSENVEKAAAVLAGMPALFEQIEQELSRFRKDSGLCRLNAKAGQGPQEVSPILAEVCQLAIEAAIDSNGVFDPTILTALEHAGYNDSFKVVAARSDESTPGPSASAPLWRKVVVQDNLVKLPANAALDLGGIAKGWTADYVAELLRPYGPAMVDAGGDIRATGLMGDKPWTLSVADPHHPDYDLQVFELADEAVTTSGVGGRRWQRQGQWMHHLIDPRTQKPSKSDVHTVTVLGPTATECEIAGKVALLLGMLEGSLYLEKRGLEGILVGHDGRTRTVGQRLGVE